MVKVNSKHLSLQSFPFSRTFNEEVYHVGKVKIMLKIPLPRRVIISL